MGQANASDPGGRVMSRACRNSQIRGESRRDNRHRAWRSFFQEYRNDTHRSVVFTDTEMEAPGGTTAQCRSGDVGLGRLCVLAVSEVDGELEQAVETTADLVPCPECGAVAQLHDRRPCWVRICLPVDGR